MALSIQERLKDLRVEHGLTLEQLVEQTHLSKSALGSYEAEDFKDISHYALIKLAKFYGVTTDYLLGLAETKNHPNADLEIYVNGVSVRQVQGANAIVDTVSATIMKQHNPGLSDKELRELITAHLDEDEFCRYVIQRDINGIALDLREAHKNDFFSVPEDNPLKGLLQAADEAASPDSDPKKASLVFICKRLWLNYGKLSGEDKAALKRLAGKSDLLKNPIPQRGRK